MYKKTEKNNENKTPSVANAVTQKKNNQALTFEDNRTKTITQKKSKTIGENSNVAQLGKKKRDLDRAKKNNPNGLQHHNRPEYQDVNERQMELINQGGISRKDAKRQAKEETKKK